VGDPLLLNEILTVQLCDLSRPMWQSIVWERGGGERAMRTCRETCVESKTCARAVLGCSGCEDSRGGVLVAKI
jgi:hypothetical protein